MINSYKTAKLIGALEFVVNYYFGIWSNITTEMLMVWQPWKLFRSTSSTSFPREIRGITTKSPPVLGSGCFSHIFCSIQFLVYKRSVKRSKIQTAALDYPLSNNQWRKRLLRALKYASHLICQNRKQKIMKIKQLKGIVTL